MQSVRDIAEDIVGREGGYVDDPDDPGGPTNHGVTLHSLRRLGTDLTGDGAVTRADVKALSRQEAVEIFLRHYFDKPRIGALPEVLRPSVFDMYVNAGANAVKILQRLLREMGQDIVVDGVIGPNTQQAAKAAFEAAPNHLVDAYGIARRNYYYAIADRTPRLRKFARRRDGGKGGWIKRAEEFIAPAYHLTPAEHADRVASWV